MSNGFQRFSTPPSRRPLGLVSAIALLWSVLVIFASPVGAQEACDLIDEVGVSDAAGLRAAVQAAEDSTGVDFAVYVTPQVSSTGSNLDAVLAGEVSVDCPQIFDSPNNVADNVVLLAVSVGTAGPSCRTAMISMSGSMTTRTTSSDE